MKSRVLLVWNESPENIRYFLFSAGSVMAHQAEAAHGTMINANENAATEALNEWLDTPEGKDTEITLPWSNPVGPSTLISDSLVIVAIFESGFML